MSGGLQITILARKPDDELLLLASDGLWDVLTNQEACSLAKRCLRRARQRGATRQSAARIAATVLTRAAVDRGSRDNVTVVVVDLMSGIGSVMFCKDSTHCGPADSVSRSCGTHLGQPLLSSCPILASLFLYFCQKQQGTLAQQAFIACSVFVLALHTS